jgi:hypothetical protein
MVMVNEDEEEDDEADADDVDVDETLGGAGSDEDELDSSDDEEGEYHHANALLPTDMNLASSRARRAASRASSKTAGILPPSSLQTSGKVSRTKANDRAAYPAEKTRGSRRDKENAPPSYESIMGPATAKKALSAPRKAKVPCSPLKTRTAASAASLKATRTRSERAVMVARRSNRFE